MTIHDGSKRTRVVRYQLAYRLYHEVELCNACVAADDHDCGTLGPVQYGSHAGDCEGRNHAQRVPL